MTLLKSVATLIRPILSVTDIRIERIPRGKEPRMLPLHSSALFLENRRPYHQNDSTVTEKKRRVQHEMYTINVPEGRSM